MAFKRFAVQVTGISPILFSNGSSIDVLSPQAQAIKWFTSQKQKKNERAMRRLFWLFSAYWDTEGQFDYGEDLKGDSTFDGYSGPMIPGANFQRCLRDAATDWKKGKEIGRAVVVENDAVIDYDGPKDANEMLADGRFYHVKPTGRGGVAVRLILPSWQAEFSLLLNDEISDPTTLGMVLDRAGMATGLGVWRPGSPKPGPHGRFAVTNLKEIAANV